MKPPREAGPTTASMGATAAGIRWGPDGRRGQGGRGVGYAGRLAYAAGVGRGGPPPPPPSPPLPCRPLRTLARPGTEEAASRESCFSRPTCGGGARGGAEGAEGGWGGWRSAPL